MVGTSFTTWLAKNSPQINVAEDAEVGGGGDADSEEDIVEKSLFKNLNKAGYLTFNAKKVFNHLLHAFTKVSILQHFNLERHILIEINASGYAIGEVLN